ncbi:hypothetical protein [Bdellovibrio reynosensis]|uniref:Solute-binding protein family 3/N-terminal domain-containing protein n=1 Tax=Bdellovibrio reynosensis TaxID=2835041 RepID=A0ABY4CCU1_9BACT|nr:hypothetical protein [Bdellovibrio reynosensis]UOF01348.1 hypothetical protein MNR06_00070 [Bdellovibrio reynosensis]
MLFLLFPFVSQAQPEITMGYPYKFDRNKALLEYALLYKTAFKEAGYTLVPKPVAIKSSFEMLVSGEVDSIAYDDMAEGSGRENVISTSFPVATTQAHIFYTRRNPVDDSKLNLYRGVILHNNRRVVQFAKKQKLKFSEAHSPYQCIQMVLDKTADYCIALKEVGMSSVEAIPDAQKNIVMHMKPVLEIPVYVSLKKSYRSDLPKIEAALKKQLTGNLSQYPLIKDNLNKSP